MDPSEDTDCTVCSVKLQLVWPHTRESTADLSHELHAQVRFLAKERRVFEQYRKLNPDLVDAKFTTAAAQLVRHASAAAEAARKLESSRAAALANADTDTKVGFFIAFLLQLPVADRRRAFASIAEAVEKPDIAIAELMEAVGVRYDGAGVLPAEHTPHALGPGSAP